VTAATPGWPDTSHARPPADHLYRSGTWLLGRHPRLARLAARVSGVIEIEDGEISIDLDHLADVIAAVPAYNDAWDAYERAHRPPQGDAAWDQWQQAGPTADSIIVGLHDFSVLSSGEAASLRLLATFASHRAPFKVSDLSSLDAEGQRLLTDWAHAVAAAHGASLGSARTRGRDIEFTTPVTDGRLL
jgi:hypothetical protein